MAFSHFSRVTTRWLHRLLIQKGLARLKTKGADLPDGTAAEKERETLRKLERDAKSNKAGAWAL
jgi:endonuclease YncB( thermonuclease family)